MKVVLDLNKMKCMDENLKNRESERFEVVERVEISGLKKSILSLNTYYDQY